MTPYDVLSLPSTSASEFFRRYHRRRAIQRFFTTLKLLFIAGLTIFFVLNYSSYIAQTYSSKDLYNHMRSLKQIQDRYQELSTLEVINLAKLTRFVSDQRLGESEALKYAALIYHAANSYGIDPMEVMALIAAESSFIADSVNEKTGDYGLGQVNWNYWGKGNGLTKQDLLDPAINIVLTCHIYNHYGSDFGRYHSGHGIKSEAYLVNIQGILSALRAQAKTLAMNEARPHAQAEEEEQLENDEKAGKPANNT